MLVISNVPYNVKNMQTAFKFVTLITFLYIKQRSLDDNNKTDRL